MPSDLAPVWPQKSNQLMKLACEGKTGWIMIKGTAYDEAAFVSLRIRMENEGENMDIQTLLKDFGYARKVTNVRGSAQPFL